MTWSSFAKTNQGKPLSKTASEVDEIVQSDRIPKRQLMIIYEMTVDNHASYGVMVEADVTRKEIIEALESILGAVCVYS